MLDKNHTKLLRYMKGFELTETKEIVPQQFRKRRWLKWGCPVVGSVLMLLVVVWPRVVTEQLYHGSILNQVLGLTYRGKQANGEGFTLKAPSAKEVAAGHIAFSKPSIETQDIKMKATAATLDVPQMRIDCDGPVEFSHRQVVICTRKAELHLGEAKPDENPAPAAS